MKKYKNKYEEELAKQAEERTRQEEARKQADIVAAQRRASHKSLNKSFADLGIHTESGLVRAGSTRGLSQKEQEELTKATLDREIDDVLDMVTATGKKYAIRFKGAMDRLLSLRAEDETKFNQISSWAGHHVDVGIPLTSINSTIEKTIELWEKNKIWKMPDTIATAVQPPPSRPAPGRKS